jgi:ParB family chromosome partitioning protein
MAKILEFRDIPLEQLVIGKAQVRTRDVGKGIEELAASIDKVGLLAPILVVQTNKKDEYEIVLGQRRFLAHRILKKDAITAGILSEKINELEAKVLSITENLVREDLNQKDKVDVCTYLYRQYGSIKVVVEETGLKYRDVKQYVKYPRLDDSLKKLVDSDEIRMDVALRAQDAAETVAEATGKFDSEEAVKFAKEMQPMSQAQQKKILDTLSESEKPSADDAIEDAKTGGKITQIIITLGAAAHQSLQQFAHEEGSTIDGAAATLIEDGLKNKGYLSD